MPVDAPEFYMNRTDLQKLIHGEVVKELKAKTSQIATRDEAPRGTSHCTIIKGKGFAAWDLV